MQGFDLCDLGRGDALRRKFTGDSFELSECFECVDDIRLAQLDRHRTAIGEQIHEPLRCHSLDRFAQRGAGYAQQRAQLTLVEFGARGNAPLDQHRAQAFDHCFVKRAP